MYCNLRWMTNDFVIFINIRSAKVYQYVNNEHHINNKIDYCQWVMVTAEKTKPITKPQIESTAIFSTIRKTGMYFPSLYNART